MKIKTFSFTIICLLFLSMAFKADTPPSADVVLKEALKEAKSKNKKVFIMFHASWCGWCHKMDKSMNDPLVKAYFDDNFIIKHLTVYEHTEELKKTENPGSEDLMKKYNSEGYGIPLWFIFDQDGKLLADSHIRPAGTGFETKGSNIIGCPSSKEEVEEFIKILKLTTKLRESELEKVTSIFRMNDPKFKGK